MKLIIPKQVEVKLHQYVRAVTTEIAGMGKISITEEGDALVEDIAIYDQEVTGGTADLSPQALAGFLTELVQKGENPAQWKLWWHSHADMAAFFSGRDTDTMDSSTEFDTLISLVVNRRRERKARFDMHRPFRVHADVSVEIQGESEDVPEDIAAEVAAKVKVRSFRDNTGYSGYPHQSGIVDVPPRGLPPGRGLGFGQNDDDDLEEYGVQNGRLVPLSEIIESTEMEGATYAKDEEIEIVIQVIKGRLAELKTGGMERTEEFKQLQRELNEWVLEKNTRDAAPN